jgi:hypothetical protein
MLKMISDQTAPQPTARESLYHLLAMIADPKAVKQRLDQLDAAAAAAEKKIAAAAEAEKATAKLEDELKAARKRNEEAMADDRAAQQVELTRRHDEIAVRERSLEQREQEIGRLHAQASVLRDERMEKTRKLKDALGSAA